MANTINTHTHSRFIYVNLLVNSAVIIIKPPDILTQNNKIKIPSHPTCVQKVTFTLMSGV